MQVAPVDLTAIVGITLGSLMLLIPIAGFTARFALRPITEAIARMRESGAARDAIALVERRLALLEQEVQGMAEMREELRRLTDDAEFRRQLQSGETR